MAVKDYAELTPISKKHKERLRDPFSKLMNPTQFATSSFYTVPFTQALDLIANRQCYLELGMAYVPDYRVVAVVVAKFRTQLARTLALMANQQGLQAESGRVQPLLNNLHRSLVAENSSRTSQVIVKDLTADSVIATVPNMPLCMREMHAGLIRDQKLKHQGRLQYGFFLRSAGLSKEEALVFFQRHFKKVTGERFQKEYAASFSHMFKERGDGTKGYSGYGCHKIINFSAPSSAVPGEHHGCPFKHYDTEHLGRLLRKLHMNDISAQDQQTILELKDRHDYGLACMKHFEATHPGVMTERQFTEAVTVDNVGTHPNSWYAASLQYQEVKNGGRSEPVGTLGPEVKEVELGRRTVSP